MKPLDTNLLDQILDNHEYIITIEEGSIGGFSSAILNYIHNLKITSTKLIFQKGMNMGHFQFVTSKIQ